MLYEIKSRYDGRVLFALECASLKLCVEEAVKARVDLRGSDLSDAHLSGSNLSDADLSGSNLRWSDLYGADLSGSNLSGSNLCGANLRGSNLSDADLSDANLRGSDLSGSNLSDADLSDANLRGSNLRDANLSGSNLYGADLSGSNLSDTKNLTADQLTPIRDDLWAVLSSAPREVEGLRQALIEGRVDGSTYSGECACLVGTIANVRGVDHTALGALKPNSSRPIERWFIGIKKGDTPETNVCAQWALKWINEWLDAMRGAFGAQS